MSSYLSTLHDNISKYYQNSVVAPITITTHSGSNSTNKVDRYSRFEFQVAAALAITLLVRDVAKTIFYTLANIFTLCLKESLRHSFTQSFTDAITHTAAIPVGWVGFLLPGTVNSFIGIPPEGLVR